MTTADGPDGPVRFEVDGRAVDVDARGSLLDALRDQLGVRSVKDGCSPQGQCGCCTVLVDGSPRVACVTPVARVRGRSVVTVDGLPDGPAWAEAFARAGASQCGFCTPGILVRLAALSPRDRADPRRVDRALLAHLCRCTGWQTIREACASMAESAGDPVRVTERDAVAAARRAELEGRAPQRVGPEVALGRGGFVDDTAPPDALVAVRAGAADSAGDPDTEWVVETSVDRARAAAGRVQGRRTTAPVGWPVPVPDGDWSVRLRTTWVEPAYLEPDAAWCAPGGEAVWASANGGAFGGKVGPDLGAVARRLAEEHGRPVRVLWSREDTVRFGPKRPPLAIGLRSDGTGRVLAARPTHGVAEPGVALPPGIEIDWVDVVGPPVSLGPRGAVWAEVSAARALALGVDSVVGPDGATARARIDDDGVHVEVECGEVLDATVLRSYCIGAAHMALGMVRSESLALDDDGTPLDLTIRSFGVLRSADMPQVHVTIRSAPSPAVNGSDAVFAAVLAAAARRAGSPERWPASEGR